MEFNNSPNLGSVLRERQWSPCSLPLLVASVEALLLGCHFIAFSRSAECRQFTYTSGSTFESTETQYSSCRAESDGGALYIKENYNARVSISFCAFLDCTSGRNGGGFHCYVGWINTAFSRFAGNSASNQGPQLYAQQEGTDPVNWTEITLIGGSGHKYTAFLYGKYFHATSTCTLVCRWDRSNSTANTMSSYGCAQATHNTLSLVFEFWMIESNKGTGGVFLFYVVAGSIRCLVVRSNECIWKNDGSDLYGALFCVRSVTASGVVHTVQDCVFMNNTATYFTSDNDAVFARCYLDRFDLVAYYRSVVTSNCEGICGEVLMAPVCVAGTPMRSCSQTVTVSPVPTPSVSMTSSARFLSSQLQGPSRDHWPDFLFRQIVRRIPR
jgi:hypothetical protein